MTNDDNYKKALEEYAKYKLYNINAFIEMKRQFVELDCGNFESYEDFLIPKCQHCMTPCCKDIPCSFAPWDLLYLKNPMYLKALLDTNLVTIAYVLGNYIIRPSRCDEKDRIVGYNNRNRLNPQLEDSRCVLHDEKTGCMLAKELRPSDGLLFSCQHEDILTFPELLALWEPYNPLLEHLYRMYNPYKSFEELRLKTIGGGRKSASRVKVKELSEAIIGYNLYKK